MERRHGHFTTPRQVRRGRRAAGTALALLSLTACSGDDTPAPASSSTSSTSTIPPAVHSVTPLTDLDVGQCFDRPSDGNERRFVALVVDCRALHTYEIYSASVFADSTSNGGYPGEDEIRETTETRCFNLFEQMIGEPWVDSPFDLHTFWPTELSWANGDRKLLCAVTPLDREPRAGSAVQVIPDQTTNGTPADDAR